MVLFGTLFAFVLYGLWRSRASRDLDTYLVAGHRMPWGMVLLSVMATQASAVTFLSTPGQGYTAGLSFVQFYFGLPLAMIVLSAIAVPVYHRLKVYTAYEYLERRFDGKTRSLAAALFLTQRGLAAGITLYAPALVLSVILGWDLGVTCLLLAVLVVLYTTLGGSQAVGHTQALQFAIIMGTMVLAFALVVRALPDGVGFRDALHVAGHAGRLNAIDWKFDPTSRYNIWAGLIGGFFLQLSYFGADQSQVGRLLTGRNTGESRAGLLFNGLLKIPMQFFILLLGVLLFGYYQVSPSPLFFNGAEVAKVKASASAEAWTAWEQRHAETGRARRAATEALIAARREGDAEAGTRAEAALRRATDASAAVREGAIATLKQADPKANTNDTNYVFLTFVLAHLPAGIVGLVLAAIFAASMNSTSAELNALATTSIVDVVKRLPWGRKDERSLLLASRLATLFWAGFAVAFAENAGRLGSLVEAVNILGSLFYGTILGLFLTGFLLKRVQGNAVFLGALAGEAVVLACWKFSDVSFLWWNVIGCLVTMGASYGLSFALREPRRAA